MKVLVTGASGFLGRSVVESLLKRGYQVRAMVRPSSNVERLNWPKEVEVYRGDLRSPKTLEHSLDGIDAVLHLAACVVGDETKQISDTIVGTENFLNVLKNSSCKRFVFASTLSIYDWSKPFRNLDDKSPLIENPYGRDSYCITKYWQEKVVKQTCEESGIDLTIFRPGFIWGKGNEYIFGIGHELGKLIMVFGPFRGLPLTHVDNCADAFTKCIEEPKTYNQDYIVDDHHRISPWKYARHYNNWSEDSGIRIPIPYFLGKISTYCATAVSRLIFGPTGKLPSILVPIRFEARFKPLKFSAQKLMDDLSWTPPKSSKECLSETFSNS